MDAAKAPKGPAPAVSSKASPPLNKRTPSARRRHRSPRHQPAAATSPVRQAPSNLGRRRRATSFDADATKLPTDLDNLFLNHLHIFPKPVQRKPPRRFCPPRRASSAKAKVARGKAASPRSQSQRQRRPEQGLSLEAMDSLIQVLSDLRNLFLRDDGPPRSHSLCAASQEHFYDSVNPVLAANPALCQQLESAIYEYRHRHRAEHAAAAQSPRRGRADAPATSMFKSRTRSGQRVYFDISTDAMERMSGSGRREAGQGGAPAVMAPAGEEPGRAARPRGVKAKVASASSVETAATDSEDDEDMVEIAIASLLNPAVPPDLTFVDSTHAHASVCGLKPKAIRAERPQASPLPSEGESDEMPGAAFYRCISPAPHAPLSIHSSPRSAFSPTPSASSS